MTTPITKEQLQRIIEISDEVISAVAGTNEDVHQESDEMIRLWDCLNDVVAPPEVVKLLAEMALTAMDAEPVAWDYEWASYITCEGPQGFKRVIERVAPPAWAIDEGQARNITPLFAAPPALTPTFHTDAARFLPECLKPEEISGDARNSRIAELMGWFDRYYSGKANPKWFKEHTAELCYYILTAPPASVVSDEMPCGGAENEYQDGYQAEWNACRSAMLQAGNSPAIPDGWVAVRERVPEVGQAVLAYRPDAPESDDPLIKMTVYTGKSHHGFNCYCTPTHWMPLPAAPQQEGK